MTSYKYQEYIQDNLSLIKSLVIKYSQFADKINEYIYIQYGVTAINFDDPTTWKYYMNLAGLYHPLDTVMYIVSLDTLQEIEFNHENLVNNPFTYENYKIGSDYYYRLINKYPGQESVIRGILNPVDINTAINAQDGSILGYDKTLVNEQETTLIDELNDYFINYYSRYKIVGYYHTDDLEPIAFYGIMLISAVQKLLNLRLKRAKTPEANDYHIYYYLESHSRLGKYICYLTLEQKLWLYRNVLYLEKHAGLSINLQDLIDVLVTKSYINISQYDADQKFIFEPNLLPEYTLYKTSINNKVNLPAKVEYTIEDYANFIDNNKVGGTDVDDYPLNNYYDEDVLIQENRYSINESKILELSGVDYTASYSTRYKESLLYTWMNLIFFKKYIAFVYFKEPRTGDLVTISAEDALIFMFYLFSKFLGIKLETIQPLLARRVIRSPKITFNEMISNTPTTFRRREQVANDLINKISNVRLINSLDGFKSYADNIYNEKIRQLFVVASEQDMYNRGYVEGMVDRLYGYEWLTFNDNGMNVTQWLNNKGLSDPGYSRTEAYNYAMIVFGAATGYKENTCTSYSGIKEAITEILRTLSSYTIQIINNEINSKLLQIDWDSVRASRRKRILKGYQYVEIGIDVINVVSKIASVVKLNIFDITTTSLTSKIHKVEKININPVVTSNNKIIIKHSVPINDLSVINYKSTGNYDSLTIEQKKSLQPLF